MAPPGPRVLIVDDDPDLRSVVHDVLDDHGFVVDEASTGSEALARVASSEPDVVLLDLGLPDMSGLDLLAELTGRIAAPVIVLTGRSGETDTVVGLELGADDYVAKPVRERELVARVRAALRRRTRVVGASGITAGDLTIDERTRDVVVAGRPVELTRREFDLLVFLARSPRQVFTRRQILEHVWGSTPEWQDDDTVAEHVYRLRRKLDPDDRGHWIETVRGVGYRFVG